MRVVARITAWAAALVTVLLIVEGGLRLLGQGPETSPVAYDPLVGWSNRPASSGVLRGAEFQAHWDTDVHGQRITPRASTDTNARDVVLLGDSFVFGTAVDAHDTIAARLQAAWDDAGRGLVAINAGTLGWDTGQAVRAFEARADDPAPAAAVLFAYENDLFWNTRSEYVTRDGPRPKLRIDPSSTALAPEPQVPRGDDLPLWKRTALGATLGGLVGSGSRPPRLELADGRRIDAELAPLLPGAGDQELDEEIDRATLAALGRLRTAADARGTELLLVTLPAAPLFEDDWAQVYATVRGLEGLDWSCDRPIERFLRLADEAGIQALDATTALRGHRSEHPEQRLFHASDWHLNPTGNDVVARSVAAFLTDRIDAPVIDPVEPAAAHARSPWPARALFWLVATLLVGGVLQSQPRRGNPVLDLLGAGAMIAFIMTVALGAAALFGALPAAASTLVAFTVVALIVGFVLYHLRDRFDTIGEVLGGFAWRGHWYLMPTLVVLIGIGSLLIVAASSPIVAPFVYTLF